jgi:RHS repeat-associated protein
VRQHLAADGSVQPGSSYAYTPFGVVASGTTPDPFGFTGELHSQGLVYLRARWYDPSVGTFTSRDPFAGFPETPYSLHYYQYGYSNPLLWTDASGEAPNCRQNPQNGDNCIWGQAGEILNFGSGGIPGIATYQQVCFTKSEVIDDVGACTGQHMTYIERLGGSGASLYKLEVWDDDGNSRQTYAWSDHQDFSKFQDAADAIVG